ncbi:MAG: hypothetical protein AVDCRST_MAG01-01-4860, partial [uncultured Rubrobacteraceae bacterium]
CPTSTPPLRAAASFWHTSARARRGRKTCRTGVRGWKFR